MRWESPNPTLREGAGLEPDPPTEELRQMHAYPPHKAGRERWGPALVTPASLATGHHYLVETVLLSLDSGVGERTAINCLQRFS